MNKYFVLSDIHGCYTELEAALHEAGYDAKNSKHWIISAGDLFDRGNENVKVYELMQSFPRRLMICGNHDEMLIHFLKTNFMSMEDVEAYRDFIFNCQCNGFWDTLRESGSAAVSNSKNGRVCLKNSSRYQE